MEYHSVKEKIWIWTLGITLEKKKNSTETTHYHFVYMESSGKRNITESRPVVAQDWRWEAGIIIKKRERYY